MMEENNKEGTDEKYCGDMRCSRKYSGKRRVLKIIIVLWIIFSVVYIVNDQVVQFHNVLLRQAYQNGRQDTLTGFIAEAKKACSPVAVGDGVNEITVINVGCLKSTPVTGSLSGSSTSSSTKASAK